MGVMSPCCAWISYELLYLFFHLLLLNMTAAQNRTMLFAQPRTLPFRRRCVGSSYIRFLASFLHLPPENQSSCLFPLFSLIVSTY